MGNEYNKFLYLSEIINKPIITSINNKKVGKIIDLAATTVQVYPKISGVIAKIKGNKQPFYIPWSYVKKSIFSKHFLIENLPDTNNNLVRANENEIALVESFLDKQIISTSGFKLVRVNDIQLLIDDSQKEKPNLYVVHIDIGFKAILRRLGFEKFLGSIYRWILSHDLKDKFVPWKYVQPMTTTNVYGSLHLKIDSSKLSEVHPADLADIIEDLGTDERISLLESLNNEAAAEVMQEIPLKFQEQIAESLDTNKLAMIINEMQMDEAVDLLDELDPKRRNEIYSLLDPEKVAELKDLSKLSVFGVGSIMNTEFIVAKETNSIEETLNILKSQCADTELIYYIYVLDEDDRLKGTVTLRHILSNDPKMRLSEIMAENIISVRVDTNIKKAAQIFFKYNFDAIPVVDDDEYIQGIITLRDVLEKVFPEITEE